MLSLSNNNNNNVSNTTTNTNNASNGPVSVSNTAPMGAVINPLSANQILALQQSQQNYTDLLNTQFSQQGGLVRFAPNTNLVQHFQLVQRPMLIQPRGDQHSANSNNLLRHLNLIQNQANFQQIQSDAEKTAATMAMVNELNHQHQQQQQQQQASNAASNSLMQLQNLNAAIQMRSMSQMNSVMPLAQQQQQHFQPQSLSSFMQAAVSPANIKNAAYLSGGQTLNSNELMNTNGNCDEIMF